MKEVKISDEVLLIIEYSTDTLNAKTKTGAQETLKFKLPKSMDTISMNTPLEKKEAESI